MAKTQYTILHEIGEYQPPIDLSEDDNDIINEQDRKKRDDLFNDED